MLQIHVRIDLCFIFSAVFVPPLLSVSIRFKRFDLPSSTLFMSRDVSGEVFIIDFPLHNGISGTPDFYGSIFFWMLDSEIFLLFPGGYKK